MSSETDSWITPTPATQPFFDGAAAGTLRLQHCTDCEAWMYPHKARCQRCGEPNLEWRDASGEGVIYAHAMLHREYHPRHAGRLPIVIAWVDLAEGVRMPSNVVGTAPEAIKAGQAVRVDFEQDPGGTAYPIFRLASRLAS